VIDPTTHTTADGGQSVDLSPREFDLLYALASDAGHVVAVDDLLPRVWGAGYTGEAQVVYVHIRWLRQKLESDPSHPRRIVTVRGIGYKLEEV
jgi:DNA-binding response OmpR family regulator